MISQPYSEENPLRVDDRKFEWDPWFHIEREQTAGACQTCQHGNMWLVVGADGTATSTSYEREEDAQDLCDDMNNALLMGWQAAENATAEGDITR